MDFSYSYIKFKFLIKERLRDIIEYLNLISFKEDSHIGEYIEWNKKNLKHSQSRKQQGYIFVDIYLEPSWLFVNSFALNKLMNTLGLSSSTFSHRSISKAEKKIYNSFNVNHHSKVCLFNDKLIEDHKKVYFEIKRKLRTKKELLELELNGINIGVDIYESILRTGLPTVDMESVTTWENIYIGLMYFLYFDCLCQLGQIKAVVLSHDNYIYMGIPSKVAIHNKIPVYLFNSRCFYKLERFNQLNERWGLIPQIFESLPIEKQTEGRFWAKRQLNLRLNGAVGIDMSYQSKSAFDANKCASQVINNGKLNVVVATHEFYDNPHGYGDLLFCDFYDWILFLINSSIENGWNLYLKAHRDSPANEIQELIKITKNFPQVVLLNSDYSFHQLRDEGIKYVLTCYGSVGHELPLLGFIVINAGNNPHSGYSFNLHPKTLIEYDKLLAILPNIYLDINEDQVFEFYYINNKLLYPLNFEINSFNTNYDSKISEYANLINCGNSFSNAINFELDRFINSKADFSFRDLMLISS
jgi:hypothetical protein